MSYKIDHAHSQIQFTARHMMISKVRGQFEKFDGEINLDEKSPQKTQISVRMDAASINTRDAQRDGHLRSPDFLDAETYPELTFVSKKVKVLDAQHALLTGDLTIRGVTNEVTLDVEYSGQATSPWGATQLGFTGHTVINRKDWGLTWNKALETGGVLVSEDITIDIELELVKQPEALEQEAQAN